MKYEHNPTCNKPIIKKKGVRWDVIFWFYTSTGIRKFYLVRNSGLNSDEYLKTVKGKKVEVNKKDRLTYAEDLISEYHEKLKNQYFNTENKQFSYIDPAEEAFTSFAEKYIQKVKEESSRTTYTSNLNVFKAYLKSKERDSISLKDINKELIYGYLQQFNSISHRNNNIRFIKAVINYCINDLEIININPIKSIKQTKAPDSDSNKPYTEQEFREILQIAKEINKEFYLLFLMVYYTLRRPEELYKLRYKDFNFKDGTIYFSGSITKTDKRQLARLPQFLIDYIKKNIPANVSADYYFLGTRQIEKRTRHITDTFAPRKITANFYKDCFKQKAIQDRIKKGQTIYSAKHTGVIYLREQGHSNKAIMSITGHTSESTLGIYAREHRVKPIVREDNLLV